MNNLSACIIAKNEETNIRRCIESLSPLQCEVIVVDTGSTDNTQFLLPKNVAPTFILFLGLMILVQPEIFP